MPTGLLKPVLALIAAVPVLTGCQTYEYRRVADGPDYETSMARCQMQSYMVPQDTRVFYGSPMYVNSMALSATIANQQRMDNFMAACMRAHGWGLFEVKKPQA